MTKLIPGAVIAAALSLIVSVPAFADLRVFACEPEWGALSEEIGGDHVDVYTATTGGQDPCPPRRHTGVYRCIAGDRLVATSSATGRKQGDRR